MQIETGVPLCRLTTIGSGGTASAFARPAPSSPGGFLKTEPNVRLFVGCVAFRRATRSATAALISSIGRGVSRYSTRATTSAGRRSEWR